MVSNSNRFESCNKKLENIKEKCSTIKNFDYLRHLCCIKDNDVKNRMKETLELSDRLDQAKEQIYELSYDTMAIGFKKMQRKGIREICDELYNEAKKFEQSAMDDTRDRNKFDFSVKYIEHFQEDLAAYVSRQPEEEVQLAEVTSKGLAQSAHPQFFTFDQLALFRAGTQAKKRRQYD